MAKHGIQEAEKKQDAPSDDTTAAEIAPGLVRMSKAGELLDVHPTAVKSHEDAGWKVEL